MRNATGLSFLASRKLLGFNIRSGFQYQCLNFEPIRIYKLGLA